MRKALITGIFGQDGSYLTELLSDKGCEVHGVVRANLSQHSLGVKAHLTKKAVTPVLHACNLRDYSAVRTLLKTLGPTECYHLAAVHYASETSGTEQMRMEQAMFEENTLSTLNLLLAIREVSRDTRFVLAGSCQMYDRCPHWPQDGSEPFCSGSLYGVSKIAASQLADFFRSVHGLHASTAILYNHESPRRQPRFVTRKIAQGLVQVKRGERPYLELGNLDSVRDWGYARDYVYGMWLMAQASQAKSYVLATGVGHTIEDFVREAADVLGLPRWREIVQLQAGLTRPTEPTRLIGNPQRAQTELGWMPSVSFRQLVELIVQHELEGTLD